ncbi:uridine kinase [Actinoplanes sp. NPDC051859]|uniref:uridine kinase n=1 Tax=Actinoplanes sp. NPDC051859 TaxID=3363909 RepID=UPI0037BBADA5
MHTTVDGDPTSDGSPFAVAGLIPPGAHRIAIDGVDGIGKTTYARALAAALQAHGRPVIHLSADGFHHPRAVRYRRGRDSADGFWLDSYDHAALVANVLAPFSPAGNRRYRTAVHDVDTDEALDLPWHTAPPDASVVVDGLFLHRDELVDHWNFSVFLSAPFEVTVPRMAARDGSHPDPDHPSQARYVGGQRRYFATCEPWTRATVVIDHTDLPRPRRLSRQVYQ